MGKRVYLAQHVITTLAGLHVRAVHSLEEVQKLVTQIPDMGRLRIF